MKKITLQKYPFINLFLLFLLLITTKKSTAQIQNALDFDGFDDYVTAPNGSALIANSNQLSLTMWVYPVNPVIGFPDFDGFAGIRNNLDADFYLLQYSSTTVEARFTNSAGQVFDLVPGGLQLNTWQHYALTYDGSMMRLYLAGQPIDSIAASGVITNTAELFYIGNMVYNGTNYYLQGKMDEVSLWNRALLPGEVNCIYHNGIDTADAGLKLYYKFNQGIAGGNNIGVTTLADSKGNSNGTLSNFTLVGPSSNWVSGVFNNISTSDTICQGDNYIFGSQMLTIAGVYYEHFPLAAGCDSVVELNLSVIAVDTSVSQNGVTLTSNQAGASYQWLDCTNGFATIPGAVAQTFVPVTNGNYAVMVTLNNCSDTSACHAITNVGIRENPDALPVSVFPNPADKQLSIDLGKTKTNISAVITDADGREIWEGSYAGITSFIINTSEWTQGVYILKITTDKSMAVVRVVKEIVK